MTPGALPQCGCERGERPLKLRNLRSSPVAIRRRYGGGSFRRREFDREVRAEPQASECRVQIRGRSQHPGLARVLTPEVTVRKRILNEESAVSQKPDTFRIDR